MQILSDKRCFTGTSQVFQWMNNGDIMHEVTTSSDPELWKIKTYMFQHSLRVYHFSTYLCPIVDLSVCVCVISHTHTQKETWSFARWLFSKSYETGIISPSRDMWVWGCVCGRQPEIWQCNSSTLAPSRREMMFHIRTERYAVHLWSDGLTISMFALFHSNTKTLICHTTQRTLLLLRGCSFIAPEN